MSLNFKLNNCLGIPLYYLCTFAFLLLETVISYIFFCWNFWNTPPPSKTMFLYRSSLTFLLLNLSNCIYFVCIKDNPSTYALYLMGSWLLKDFSPDIIFSLFSFVNSPFIVECSLYLHRHVPVFPLISYLFLLLPPHFPDPLHHKTFFKGFVHSCLNFLMTHSLSSTYSELLTWIL